MLILLGALAILAVWAWRLWCSTAPSDVTPVRDPSPATLDDVAADYRLVARQQRRDGMPHLARVSDDLGDHYAREACVARRGARG